MSYILHFSPRQVHLGVHLHYEGRVRLAASVALCAQGDLHAHGPGRYITMQCRKVFQMGLTSKLLSIRLK